ncbi:MAG TPA: MerR family transcriptional regulator [Streptosporangiaceae bacterium]
MKLTIGQVAAYVGVTIRAVRHYHQRGLLTEPDRDASGYRRYDASAVVDLIKIKTLAEAGVPLGRISELLQAEPVDFADAVGQIDKAIDLRISELAEQKRRIAGLVAGDTLFLPPKIVDLLDGLRAAGVSERTIRMERDGWIVLAAGYPDEAGDAAHAKLKALDEPEFRQIYLAYDEAADWDPADPRLEQIADLIMAFASSYDPGPDANPPPPADDPAVLALMAGATEDQPPSWLKIDELCRTRVDGAAH